MVVVSPPPPPEPERELRRWRLPILLFFATCLSTFTAAGPAYAAAVMTILLCHELGHYLQARRHLVPASPPYFIPLPLFSPFGTLGAVIAMRPHVATGRALYDIAITGPLAGLVPTLIFGGLGLSRSSFVPNADLPEGPAVLFRSPLLFDWLSHSILGPRPEDHTLMLDPLAFAGWVGIFITALNLLPVGQLDGGHILYTLAPRFAHQISAGLFFAAGVAVIIWGLWHWVLFLGLLAAVGLRHPPVRDQPPFELGVGRRILGWATLLFLFVGLTPEPLSLVGD